MALLAELRVDTAPRDQRRVSRRTLRLEVESAIGANAARGIVRNLSETGLLLETAEPLANGDTLAVELPEAGTVGARVVWCRAPYFGCEFENAVSRGAVAAALLKSPLDEPATELLSPPDSTWDLPVPLSRRALPAPSFEAATALMLFAAAAMAFVLALATFRAG